MLIYNLKIIIVI